MTSEQEPAVATTEPCAYEWEDGWASRPTPHHCIVADGHERMHVCECGAVTAP